MLSASTAVQIFLCISLIVANQKSKSHPATRTSDSSLDASLQYNSYDAPTPLAQPTSKYGMRYGQLLDLLAS